MPKQDLAVVDSAVSMARTLDTDLHFIYVDPAGYRVQTGPADNEAFAPIDSDADADDDAARSAGLEAQIATELEDSGVRWSYRSVRGDAAHELAGSVAAHLAHHQLVPLLIVPIGRRAGERHYATG